MNLLRPVSDSPWQILGKKQNFAKPATSFVPAKGSIPVPVAPKHTCLDDDDDDIILPAQKKRKTVATTNEVIASTSPLGIEWDAVDYSCAYDALFGILYNIWLSNPNKWSKEYSFINDDLMGSLAFCFEKMQDAQLSFESI